MFLYLYLICHAFPLLQTGNEKKLKIYFLRCVSVESLKTANTFAGVQGIFPAVEFEDKESSCTLYLRRRFHPLKDELRKEREPPLS